MALCPAIFHFSFYFFSTCFCLQVHGFLTCLYLSLFPPRPSPFLLLRSLSSPSVRPSVRPSLPPFHSPRSPVDSSSTPLPPSSSSPVLGSALSLLPLSHRACFVLRGWAIVCVCVCVCVSFWLVRFCSLLLLVRPSCPKLVCCFLFCHLFVEDQSMLSSSFLFF